MRKRSLGLARDFHFSLFYSKYNLPLVNSASTCWCPGEGRKAELREGTAYYFVGFLWDEERGYVILRCAARGEVWSQTGRSRQAGGKDILILTHKKRSTALPKICRTVGSSFLVPVCGMVCCITYILRKCAQLVTCSGLHQIILTCCSHQTEYASCTSRAIGWWFFFFFFNCTTLIAGDRSQRSKFCVG